MSRIKELIKKELERSEDELRAELKSTDNSNYRHQLFGGLFSLDNIKLFLDNLSEPGEPSKLEVDTSELGELSQQSDYNDVTFFIMAAKNGQRFENRNGDFETINEDVYKVMNYILNENIAPKNVTAWVNENRDMFAKKWLEI